MDDCSDPFTEDAWFEKFQRIEDTLVQSLILIAVMHRQDLIKDKESAMMKKFILTSAESKASEILKSFLRKKSLY